MAGDLELLIGKWTVKVKSWTWEYEFFRDGRVTWRDLNSAERGAGTWSATPKLVNIQWKDSQSRESWQRPLMSTTDKTWYESSYFRGKYQIAKAGSPGSSPSGPQVLSRPPAIYQKNLYCWAAGAASWRRAMRRGNETVEQLVERFGGYLNGDGSLPEGEPDDPAAERGGMKVVFAKLGIHVESIPARNFTYSFASEKLKAKGHLLLMAAHGGDMGHTYVVFGVGDPSQEYFSVFDPLFGRGYQNLRFSEIHGNNVYVGWAQ